ncbi:hypothetical protein J3A83DRAFT_4368681 [Scleroderma citrinum]
MSYKSWTLSPYSSGTSAYGHVQSDHWTGAPAPTPGAPHMNTVSLPHPNSTPHHPSSFYDMSSGSGTPHILALNPLLSYASRPPLYFNVAQDIQHIRLLPGCAPTLLHAHALNHSSTQLYIRFPQYPHWSIEVTNSRGVTVYDVLIRIRETLNYSISSQEASVSPLASEYFRARTRTDPREYMQGVKRVDLLGPNVFFAGLSPSINGPNCWDIHFCPNV